MRYPLRPQFHATTALRLSQMRRRQHARLTQTVSHGESEAGKQGKGADVARGREGKQGHLLAPESLAAKADEMLNGFLPCILRRHAGTHRPANRRASDRSSRWRPASSLSSRRRHLLYRRRGACSPSDTLEDSPRRNPRGDGLDTHSRDFLNQAP